MKVLLIIFIFSLSNSLYSQDTAFLRLPPPSKLLSEQLESQGINTRKYKLKEVCTIGHKTECKQGNKRLSKMVKYFDRINKKTSSTDNTIGAWEYRIESFDKDTIIVMGNKAVSMHIAVRYEFKKR